MNTRNKVLLTAAVVGVIGVLIAVGTSALFSASTVSSENTAATGSLSATNSGLYFDSGAGDGMMKPIDSILNARLQNVTVSGTGTVTNNGALTGDFSIGQPSGATAVTGDLPTPVNSPIAPFAARPGLHETLQLCISDIEVNPANRDCGIYNGPFVMGATISPIAVLPPGSSRSLYFEVWMEEDPAVPTDNGYQNKNARAYFEFTAN